MINIFKDIIDVNKILYLDVKIVESDKKYKVNINDYSKYFEEKLLIQEENQLIDLVEEILATKGELRVNDSQNIKQFENNKYLKTINSYCDITIYDKLNHEYYIVISINECVNNDLNSCNDLEQIDDHIANISHELRTPINIISSASQVLTQKLDNVNCEKKYQFIQYTNIIDKNISRMVKLIDNLIDTTKIEEGMFDHKPKNEDIVKFVEDICLSVDEFAKYNKTKIIFDTNVEEKIIAFDPESMERVLLNLLSNAIKFNNSKENIYVNMNCNEKIQISVRDSGIGIEDDKLDYIFEKFSQIENVDKREGSGIGLFLVKSIVKKHGGNITVNSKINKGSEFIVTLPNILIDEKKDSDYIDDGKILDLELIKSTEEDSYNSEYKCRYIY